MSDQDTKKTPGTEASAPEAPFDWSEFDEMAEEQVMAAALSDPDNPPLTEAQFARMKRVAKVKQIRWKLNLSREMFAARFRIPLNLVTAWERHEIEPDAVANAYLDVIAASPEAVDSALAAGAQPKAAE